MSATVSNLTTRWQDFYRLYHQVSMCPGFYCTIAPHAARALCSPTAGNREIIMKDMQRIQKSTNTNLLKVREIKSEAICRVYVTGRGGDEWHD